MPPRGRACVMPPLLLVVLLLATASSPAAAQLCDTSSTFRRTYQGVVQSAVPTQLQVLGQGSKVEVTCLGVRELPTNVVGCELASLLLVCRDNIQDPVNCQALAEFLYQETPAQLWERGTLDGPQYTWILAIDGRSKPQGCYPRSIDLAIVYDIRSREQGESSSALSLVVILFAATVLLCILAFVFTWFYRKSQQERQDIVPEHQMREVTESEARERELAQIDGGAPPLPPPPGAHTRGGPGYYGDPRHVETIDRATRSPTMDAAYPPIYPYNHKVHDEFKSIDATMLPLSGPPPGGAGSPSQTNPIQREFAPRAPPTGHGVNGSMNGAPLSPTSAAKQVRFAGAGRGGGGGRAVDPNYEMYPSGAPGSPDHSGIDIAPVLYRNEQLDRMTPPPPPLRLACADCGAEIDHPATPAICPVTGRTHPGDVDGSPRRAGRYGVACADCGLQVGDARMPARCAVTGHIHPTDFE